MTPPPGVFAAPLLSLLLAAPSAVSRTETPAPPPVLQTTTRGVWPLQPRPPVVRGFEPPSSLWGPGHRGVDLLGRVGEPVHAALGGRVAFAGPLAGRGVVVIEHGGRRTTYEPVAAAVKVGQPVTRGQTIGTLELAQSHCFPRSCLHWGLIRDRGNVYLDPLTLVGGGPVRLLPVE